MSRPDLGKLQLITTRGKEENSLLTAIAQAIIYIAGKTKNNNFLNHIDTLYALALEDDNERSKGKDSKLVTKLGIIIKSFGTAGESSVIIQSIADMIKVPVILLQEKKQAIVFKPGISSDSSNSGDFVIALHYRESHNSYHALMGASGTLLNEIEQALEANPETLICYPHLSPSVAIPAPTTSAAPASASASAEPRVEQPRISLNQLTHKEVDGNGDCLFVSIAMGLENNRHMINTINTICASMDIKTELPLAHKLRLIAANQLMGEWNSSNSNQRADFLRTLAAIPDLNINQIVKDIASKDELTRLLDSPEEQQRILNEPPIYLDRIKEHGFWGGPLEIKALVDALSITIVILQPRNQATIVKPHNQQINHVVAVFYNGTNHYAALTGANSDLVRNIEQLIGEGFSVNYNPPALASECSISFVEEKEVEPTSSEPPQFAISGRLPGDPPLKTLKITHSPNFFNDLTNKNSYEEQIREYQRMIIEFQSDIIKLSSVITQEKKVPEESSPLLQRLQNILGALRQKISGQQNSSISILITNTITQLKNKLTILNLIGNQKKYPLHPSLPR